MVMLDPLGQSGRAKFGPIFQANIIRAQPGPNFGLVGLAQWAGLKFLALAAKIYSIKAHQEYVVVVSSKKLLVLRCKKVEECRCPWKLRAMVVKDTSLFVINKYTEPHTCVNPCLNWDYHQLDSKLVATHIKALIQAQFTLTTAAI